MPSYSAQGLVLKKTKLSESDLIVTLLSADGLQIRAVAKGARKPGAQMASRLELCSVVDLLLHKGRSLDVVSEARLVEPNTASRAMPERMAAAEALCEFLEVVTRDSDPEPRLYPMACEALRCIGAVPTEGLELVLAAAFFKFTGQIGYLLSLHECALCGALINGADEEGHYVWSALNGGLMCISCSKGQESPEGSLSISPSMLGWLRVCMEARFKDIENSVREKPELASLLGDDVLAFSEEWMHVHLGIHIKSVRFLRDFLSE